MALRSASEIEVETPDVVARFLADGAGEVEAAMSKGAAAIIQKVTVNVGMV